MSFEILGIGTTNPEHSIQQSDAAVHALSFSCQTETTDQLQRLLPVLYRRAGVKTRHSVVLENSSDGEAVRQTFYQPSESPVDLGPATSIRMQEYEKHAGLLAIAAVHAALDSAKIDPAEVTHLVTVSCSGFSAPGFDLQVLKQPGFSPDVSRTHIGFMGCHGALNGLRVAKAFTDSDPEACVVICAVELCTLHQQYGWCPDKIVANALFADGAAAVVGKQSQGSSSDHWNLVASGSTVVPNSEELMSWRIGDHGFEMTLSPEIPDLIKSRLRPWLVNWLAAEGTRVEEIGSWAIHPGGPRILTAVAEAIEFEEEKLATSREILSEFGNMSSPTVLFILQRLQAAQAARPCVMLGFGPGLVIEAALVK
ncbi:type III polyketide synthase [Gimesia algae]|uniref:Alpha-pyrone synthesis polyketide synthase-like Pks18 n=1 Tax=Gimesia algae TaxID=2527971 RepID=A0A517VAM0_9PLAN|nr:type III polyketide synthase [Gimesia algae]QDT90052.1 Alpha-pyrone synthesis polyketide synthase-like Pks18 [Gimesia algae]